MGFFDIFKNKSSDKKDLTLEELLQKAAKEPAFRADFYKRLVSDKLVVITEGSNIPHGEQVLKESTKVNLVSYPDGKIPVFTSEERIFDKGVIKEKIQFLEMAGKDLFALAKGATFLLNPYSDYGKELLPNEIEQILNGTILTSNSKVIEVQKPTKVQVGQPAKYPTEIVNSLQKLFVERTNVNAAYVAWIYDTSSGQPPHYIFAIDGNGDLQSVMNEAGFTAQQILGKNEIIDFMRIDNTGGINNYFLKQQPFYKR